MSHSQEKPFRPTRKLVIDREWSERASGDGYWILLKDGFHCEDVHAIHEDTKAAAYARIRDVRPCTCVDCVAKERAVTRSVDLTNSGDTSINRSQERSAS